MSGSPLLCFNVLESMLSDVLILVMWPKWVHKHLQEVSKNVFNWEKPFIDFLELVTKYFALMKTILINCTGKFCCRHGNFQNTEAARRGVLKNITQFTGKYARVYFFNKVAALRPATLLKKRLRHWCFPVNFVKFLKTPF